jgi:hypothetical protein
MVVGRLITRLATAAADWQILPSGRVIAAVSSHGQMIENEKLTFGVSVSI